VEIRAIPVEAQDVEHEKLETIVGWANEHIKELHRIIETGRCLCGNELKDSILFDRGFNVGIECEGCK